VLRVIAPAEDRNLLTLEELRDAAGVPADDATDAKITTLGLRVSDLISRACNVAAGGPHPPTLRKEVVADDEGCWPRGEWILSRRFAVVTAATIAGVPIALDGLSADFSTGILSRLDRCLPTHGRYDITYEAGFEEVPEDLKYAAVLAVREFWASADRDPLLRSENVEGIGRFDYQIDATSQNGWKALPYATMAAISPYRSVVI
jgi:hypothetical protein